MNWVFDFDNELGFLVLGGRWRMGLKPSNEGIKTTGNSTGFGIKLRMRRTGVSPPVCSRRSSCCRGGVRDRRRQWRLREVVVVVVVVVVVAEMVVVMVVMVVAVAVVVVVAVDEKKV
ncbi:hypothetical protein Hdeb2414_s0003g00087401 [Helianthus debilis subsp. tardiflorus]